jgi:nitrate reductase delta subunit
MGTYTALAEAMRYPWPGQLKTLQQHLEPIPNGSPRQALAAFVNYVQSVPLAEREELYTRTWDLDPVAAPYLGFQIWGENYKRGNFMAQLNQVLKDNGVDLAGELPDHLVPVLRYLDRAEQPSPALLEILDKAVRAMRQAFLDKSETRNPYLSLLDAILASGGDK